MKSYIKGLIFTFFAIMFIAIGDEVAFAQTPNTNYVRIRIPQIPVTDTSLLDTIPVQRQSVMIEYSDALGRAAQSVQVQGSAKQMDIVTPYVYDNMSRIKYNYLAYPDESTNSSIAGTLRANAPNGVLNFYNPSSPGASKIATDVSPYAQTVYESSPLGRVVQQGAPGAVYQPGAGHTVTINYGVNAPADGINYYTNFTSPNYYPNGLPFPTTTPFAQGVLSKTIVTDENGHRTAIWKDRQGRAVTKTQLDAPTAFYSTDYIYNDLNQLSAILSPAAKQQIFTEPDLSDPPNYITQVYAFHYDSLGRLVEKMVPGKGYTYTVYNHADEPVLSQDSNMRAKNQWMFMKYDAEGRIIQTGIYTNTAIISRKAMQYYCDNSVTVLWETWQPGIGYTNNAFPQQNTTPVGSPLSIYTIYYYDDYSFVEAANKPFQTNIYATVPTMRTMGMLTGVSIYILGTANQRLVTVNYYDNQNRLIQRLIDNHLGQVDVVDNQYNFIGKLTGSQRITTPIPGNPLTVKDRYVYDPAGRLLDTYESFQGSSEVDISHNVYNEVGQKVSEGLHSGNFIIANSGLPANITEDTTIAKTQTDVATTSVALTTGFSFLSTANTTYKAQIQSGTNFAQTQEFRYNIRGWLTNINNGTLTNDNGLTESDPNALFGETISYDQAILPGATPQYNGNVSAIIWRNKIEQTSLPGLTTGGQGYAFTYDNVDRFNQSTYYTQSNNIFTQSTTGAFAEKISSYDVLDNIGSLQRQDKSGNLLNNLTYTYPPWQNQLSSVNDSGSQNITGSFIYDGNGNMTGDSYKGITITYNYLDLIDTVKQGNSKLVFTYDAAGNKLYKQLIVNGTVTSQRHYIEDAELTASSSVAYDGKVESIAMAEGRILLGNNNTYQYEYYMQDHLYTNRVTFRPNSNGTISLGEVQNYYPFGGDMGDATMNYSASPQNLHQYNGKELQPELNLDTYDFGARHYNPTLGRWMGIDPMATEYADLSPYNYVENNPMNLIDPNGMQPSGNQGYQFGFHIGGGSTGSAGSVGLPGWLGFGISGTYSGIEAINAFKPSIKPTINLNSDLKKVQGNVIQANQGGEVYSSNMIIGDDGLNNNGNDPNDPMRGGRQNQRDQSIKRYPKEFQKWYHKEIKPDVHPGRDATPEELEEGYQDWLDHNRKTISTGITWGLIGWGAYEGIKWGAAIILAPETGGGSLVGAGVLP